MHNLGKPPVLGYENEKKIANHIKTFEKSRFPCTHSDVQRMEFQLDTKLNIKHNFNNG